MSRGAYRLERAECRAGGAARPRLVASRPRWLHGSGSAGCADRSAADPGRSAAACALAVLAASAGKGAAAPPLQPPASESLSAASATLERPLGLPAGPGRSAAGDRRRGASSARGYCGGGRTVGSLERGGFMKVWSTLTAGAGRTPPAAFPTRRDSLRGVPMHAPAECTSPRGLTPGAASRSTGGWHSAGPMSAPTSGDGLRDCGIAADQLADRASSRGCRAEPCRGRRRTLRLQVPVWGALLHCGSVAEPATGWEDPASPHRSSPL